MAEAAVPAHARVVVVGGGIMGCSTAYHLAKLGLKDVVLLERGKLSCGSTFHAAGLVGQLRSSASITQLLGRSVELYRQLEAETGQDTGWRMHGGLRLACSRERLEELKRQATTARSFGLEMHLLSPAEAKKLWPLMETHDLVGAAFLPTDGQISPSDVTQALIKGAKARGATLIEDCRVTGVEVRGGRVEAVETQRGRIRCEVLVNCCGLWSREFGRMAGVEIPILPVQHQYLITEPIAGVSPDLPTLRDPDRLTYYKEEAGGLVMGGYEPDPLAWDVGNIPDDWTFKLLPPDWGHFERLAELAIPRVPALEKAGAKLLLNGPEAFTPDGMFILGEAPGLRGYFVGTGFNAFGIAAAGGAGWALAEWILSGEPPYNLWAADIRRFGAPHRDPGWVRARTLEAYGKHYTIPWPHEEHHGGRPHRKSPLYETLRAAGACFGEKQGWERPNWFARPGEEAKDAYSFGRQNWFERVGEEHRAVREAAGLFDQTSFSKFLVEGRDAAKALSWVCANDVERPVGTLAYTQLLNRRGGIECDLTVARLAEDRFYLTTGTAFGTHDLHWIASNIPPGLDARVVDVTESRSVLALMGPKAREALAKVCGADLSNAGFPFASVRELEVAGRSLLALRITYVGELGWELHVPVDSALPVYQALLEAGRPLGLVNAGYRAIESLRLEKGYRAWGSDITPDDTPLEAGLGWAVKLKKPTPFLGRGPLERQRAEGVNKRLVCLTVEDPEAVLLGRETIYRDGVRVGWLTSGGFGYTVGLGIGYGYVRGGEAAPTRGAPVTDGFLSSGRYELEVATRRVPAELRLGPLYDPRMERIKA